MTGTIGGTATAKVVEKLAALNGAASDASIRTQNVAVDLAERSGAIRYPAVQVYCEKIVNSMVEKFRTFSGRVEMAVELRNSSDRLDGLQDSVEEAAGVIMQMLDANRGDWGDGMFYSGGYQVSFAAAKHGGKNFVQMAKVTFEIGVSIN